MFSMHTVEVLVDDREDASIDHISTAPRHPRAAWPLQIYARDDDTRIRLISDRTPVSDGRLFDVAFCESETDAAAMARACASLLGSKPDMSADELGWHRLPAGAEIGRFLPNLLQAARNTVWAGGMPGVASAEPVAPSKPLHEPVRRQHWTMRRVAWFGFLVGLGWTAKRIAADELIQTTPNNVYRQAHRFRLSLSDGPQGQVCVHLPAATLATIDRAAAAAHLQRDAFVKRLLIRAANDPARFGLTVVSA